MTSQPPDRRRQKTGTPSRPSSSPSPESPAGGAPCRHPPAPHLALGNEGEARAADYLAAQGYRIVARNVRAGGVELDLVVRRGRTVVFVEVKTRRSHRFGAPELAIDARKRRRLVRGAYAWLRERGRGFQSARFDVIAWQVFSRGSGETTWKLRHIQNAFEAEDPA